MGPDLCDKLGYDSKTNSCIRPCPQIDPTTCQDCITLGPKCVKEMCDVKCAQLYQPSTNTCKPVCPKVNPTDCKSCMALGDRCIAEKGYTRKCENWGYRNGSCERICPALDARTCDDCKRLGPIFVKKNGYASKCAGYGYDIKENTCYTDPSQCPYLYPTKCEDCVKQGKHHHLCRNMGWQEASNTCKDDDKCPLVVPSDCEDCKMLSNKCLHKKGYMHQCKQWGFDPEHRSCGDVCIAIVPETCQDCIKLGPKCCGKWAKKMQVNGMEAKEKHLQERSQ